jgi:ribonuclease HII
MSVAAASILAKTHRDELMMQSCTKNIPITFGTGTKAIPQKHIARLLSATVLLPGTAVRSALPTSNFHFGDMRLLW